MNRPRSFVQLYSLLTFAVLAAAVFGVVTSPLDPDGPVRRVLFLHLPAAATTFLACGAVFVGSVGQLLRGRSCWDDLAEAAGVVAVVACTILLVTGMIWGKQAWDEWWTWSPSLTFSLLLWILYLGYVVQRPLVSAARRASVSAVYGVVAFLDVPLVNMSVRILPDKHPTSMTMDAGVKRTLLICTIATIMLAAGAVLSRMRSRREAGAPSREPSPLHAAAKATIAH
jgi:heme exporter protein C